MAILNRTMSSKELGLESQVSIENQATKTSVNIFSVRNIAIVLTVFVLAVTCILTYIFKDQILGWFQSVNDDVIVNDGGDDHNENSQLIGNIIYSSLSGSYLNSFSVDTKEVKFLRENSCASSTDSWPLSSDLKSIVYIVSYVYSSDQQNVFIYIQNNDGSEIMVVENENIDNTLKVSFSPDDSKIIYAIKIGGKSQIYSIDAISSPKNNDLIQEFGEDSKLRGFKYTIDGKSILAIFSKNEKYTFRIINLDDKKRKSKDIEIDPKTFCKNLSQEKSFFVGINFLISKDHSKIVFTNESEEQNEIYVINLNKTKTTDNSIPKKIYENKNGTLYSLNWSPNFKNIVLNEYDKNLNLPVIKIINIDPDAEKVEVLKDKDDNLIEGYALKWTD